MKRKITLFFTTLLLMVVLIGCNKANENQTNQTENQENVEQTDDVIKLTVWAEEDNFEMLNEMIGKFKAKNSEVKLEFELVVQSDSGLRDVLLDDVIAGPDVFHFPDDQLNSLIAGGVLAPVPNANEVKTANTEASVDAASLNNTLYAYPITADNGYFLYYNKKYINENDVKTLDDLLEAANKCGKQIEMELNSGWYMYAFFGGAGLTVGLNEDGVTNYCNWNSTENTYTGLDVANSIVDIVNNPAFMVAGDGSFVTNATEDTVVAGISGVWNAIGIKEAWGEDYGACKLPTFTCKGEQVQMSSFTGFKMIGVNRYSKNIEWAHKFADFISNEQNQTIRFVQRNQGPSNIKAAASDEVMKVPAIQAVIAQSEFGNLQRVGNNFWSPTTDFANAIINKTPESEDLQALLDKMVQGITGSVAQ